MSIDAKQISKTGSRVAGAAVLAVSLAACQGGNINILKNGHIGNQGYIVDANGKAFTDRECAYRLVGKTIRQTNKANRAVGYQGANTLRNFSRKNISAKIAGSAVRVYSGANGNGQSIMVSTRSARNLVSKFSKSGLVNFQLDLKDCRTERDSGNNGGNSSTSEPESKSEQNTGGCSCDNKSRSDARDYIPFLENPSFAALGEGGAGTSLPASFKKFAAAVDAQKQGDLVITRGNFPEELRGFVPDRLELNFG